MLDDIDEYRCPLCGMSNETCRCDDMNFFEEEDEFIDYGYPFDEYFDDEFESDEDLEIICEFNERQLTRAEARELFGEEFEK